MARKAAWGADPHLALGPLGERGGAGPGQPLREPDAQGRSLIDAHGAVVGGEPERATAGLEDVVDDDLTDRGGVATKALVPRVEAIDAADGRHPHEPGAVDVDALHPLRLETLRAAEALEDLAVEAMDARGEGGDLPGQAR